MDKIQIKRSISIQLSPSGKIQFWMAPPRAFTLEEPPEFLAELCRILNQPTSLEDLCSRLKNTTSDASIANIIQCVKELYDYGVIEETESSQATSRYDRHELYYDIFGKSKEDYSALKNKKVGLIGAGGIGSSVAMLLAAAGVGTIKLMDDDLLEETNLPRVVLLEEADVGLPKVQQIQKRLMDRNSSCKISLQESKIKSHEEIVEFLGDCDAWVLSADSPPKTICSWTNQAALKCKVPFITAGYAEINGLIGPFIIPGQTACHFCSLEEDKTTDRIQLNSRLQATSYGPLNTIVASMATNEVIRYLLGLEVETAGKQIILDSSSYKTVEKSISIHPECECQQ